MVGHETAQRLKNNDASAYEWQVSKVQRMVERNELKGKYDVVNREFVGKKVVPENVG